MYANSSPIASRQTGPHTQLSTLVARHAGNLFRQPIADHNRIAFEESMARWRASGTPPLILDAGCGVGLSTMNLAAQFPDHFVIGVDQSTDRSTRNTEWSGAVPLNHLRVRANLVDYWRLLLENGRRPAQHYLLYPNPWPKIGHLARRWHGHAIFPTIVALGGQLECRSNWRIYVEEFAGALTQLTHQAVACESFSPDRIITPFEQKYLASGHALWRCRIQLPPSAANPAQDY
jgi:tRNA G46 methylase TrmB